MSENILGGIKRNNGEPHVLAVNIIRNVFEMVL